MKPLLRFCVTTSLGIWLGASIFLLLITSALFSRMPDVAGRVASLALPVYYKTGAICALVALASVILSALYPWQESWAKRLTPVVLMLALAGVNYYAGWVVLPQAREARLRVHEYESSSAEQPARVAKARERFRKLHRLSIRLLGVVFFLLAVTLLFSAFALRM
ncbi:MAG: DUF4149 domain-containing protein [Nitrospinota bacterium]